MTAIDSEIATYRTARDNGQTARVNLLEPKNVPGSIGEKYREAVAESEAAASAVEQARRDIREQTSRIESEEEWITQIVGESAKEITPLGLLKQPKPVVAESFRLQEHRAALARAHRRKAEAEARLVEAEKAAARARKAVEALIPEVLKA